MVYDKGDTESVLTRSGLYKSLKETNDVFEDTKSAKESFFSGSSSENPWKLKVTNHHIFSLSGYLKILNHLFFQSNIQS